MSQIPSETSNFKGGKVIYIDTENTFRLVTMHFEYCINEKS